MTALVVRTDEAVFENELFQRLVSRFGGVVCAETVDEFGPERVVLFGIKQADGREAQRAARWGRRLLNAVPDANIAGPDGAPVADNDTEEGRELNRRTELTVTGN